MTFPPSSPLDYDFTKLDNYIPIEKTLEAQNETWNTSKSQFYSLFVWGIYADRCVRDKPQQLEFSNAPYLTIEDWQLDAFSSIKFDYCCPDIMPPSKEEIEFISGIKDFVWFRYFSIIHSGKGTGGMAGIVNNNLYFNLCW